MEKWPVHKRELILDHPFVQVTFEEIELPDGRIIPDWPIIHAGNFINILVLNERQEAMILEGYKHGVGHSSWQVVGGYLEPGEDPLLCAQRELMEETGYEAPDWVSLGAFVVDANRRTGVGHFFLALGARAVAAPDHDVLEHFDIRWIPLPTLRQATQDGRVAIMSHAATIGLGLTYLGASRLFEKEK